MSKIPQELRLALTTCQHEVDDTTEIAVIKYQTLMHTRHDVFHYLVNTILSCPNVFGRNDFLTKEFGEFIPDHLSRYSPDVVVCWNSNILIIDISCSWNFEFNKNEKEEKYVPIVDWINSNTNYTAHPFFMFWVKPDLSNFRVSLGNLYSMLGSLEAPFILLSEKIIDEALIFFDKISRSIEEFVKVLPYNTFSTSTQRKQKDISGRIGELDKLNSKNFNHYTKVKDSIQGDNLSEVLDIVKKCFEDQEVYDYLKDTKHNEDSFQKAFDVLLDVESEMVKGHTHPTFFIPFSDFNEDVLDYLTSHEIYTEEGKTLKGKLKKEQTQIMHMLEAVMSIPSFSSDKSYNFFRTLLVKIKHLLDFDGELNMFNTGMFTTNLETEAKLGKLYKNYRDGVDSSVSKREFFKKELGQVSNLVDTLPFMYRNKCIRLSASDYKYDPFVVEAGTSYRKLHEVREYKRKSTIIETEYLDFMAFMDLLEEVTPNMSKTHPFLGTISGPDDPSLKEIKDHLLSNQREFLSMVQSRNAHSMSKHTMLSATQLLHFNEMNTTDSTFYAFTSGQPNCLHLVQGGSVQRGSDVGQSFMTIMITHDERWANKVYGTFRKYPFTFKTKQLYLIVTPWVRLNCERLSFMKDQYYSTLSTSYDSWSRSQNPLQSGFLRHMYTFRVCISMSPSQKVAELLMDTRYIIMASISEYSNVFELIKEKFRPPYKNCLEQFIVRQLCKKCSEIVTFLHSNPIKPNKPGFTGLERRVNTLGGDFIVPSLWSDCILADFQEMFDDIFVYVHTSKEPSSVYHEQVKAINTILTFQQEYDKLDSDVQAGCHTFATLKKWLLSGSKVGCYSKAVCEGSKIYAEKYKDLYKSHQYVDSCKLEPISELVSTKACIPEVNRQVNIEKKTKSKMKNVMANLGNYFQTLDSSPFERRIKDTYFKLDVDLEDEKYLVVGRSLRVKVHDALLDWISKHPEKDTVLDLALWNLFENNSRVVADTCIKAQYGAKREFYVINLGAKALARVLENAYKILATRSSHEMISVPGDKKFECIQSAINEVILASERRQDKMFEVNGDCTKWSACETMTSFLSMSFGLESVFGTEGTAINNAAICAWANKEIQIPQSILQNLHFMSDATAYITETTTIHSTQNFLQGMFNYMSSMKAVIATEFSVFCFHKLFPSRFLSISHLEHSDDYTLIVRVNDTKSFEDFRVVHKLIQKMFGINDSTKKTNVQKQVLEFISLFSFNGQLYYPLIKKTKEVGTNLPCTDFRSDYMCIQSRVAEAVRMGATIDSAYFMQRVHCASIADAYSVTPGMKNGTASILECFSRPPELFGFPDTLPIFSHLSKGSPEYFRLFNFAGQDVQKQLLYIYNLGIHTCTIQDEAHPTYGDLEIGFYNPTFSYPIKTNKVKIIKQKLGLSLESTMEYFSENYADMFLKPVENTRFLKWLKSMYYNKSFVKAYMRVSRSAMILRHSLFSSKPCILHPADQNKPHDTSTRFLTIPGYIEFMISESMTQSITPSEDFLKEICCYTNTLEICYNFIKDLTIIPTEYFEPKATVQKTPSPLMWLKLENKPENVLQYLVNRENFFKDHRDILSEVSLYRDVSKLQQHYSIDAFIKEPLYTRKVFKEMISQQPKSSYSLVFVTDDTSILGYFRQYLSLNIKTGHTYKLVSKQEINISSGINIVPPVIKDWKTIQNSYDRVLSQCALLYRAICLTSHGEVLTENLEKFLNRDIPTMNCNVRGFLSQINLNLLTSLKLGENTKKISCFLKSKLLSDSSDLNSFIEDGLFYEYTYLNVHQINGNFTEAAFIKFKGVIGKANFYKDFNRSFIILELPPVNRIVWFYMYTIAQRIFGLISQSVFDMKMSESLDLALPRMDDFQRSIVSDLLPIKNLRLYTMINNVILQTSNIDSASLPILEHTTRYYPKFARRNKFGKFYSVTTTDLQAYSGNVLLFKLPFGNLYYEDCLGDVPTDEQDIMIDGLPFRLLKNRQWLKKFLINEHEGFVDAYDVSKDIKIVLDQAIKKHTSDYKNWEDWLEVIDLDLCNISNVSKEIHSEFQFQPSLKINTDLFQVGMPEQSEPMISLGSTKFGLNISLPDEEEEKEENVQGSFFSDYFESESPGLNDMSEESLLSSIQIPSLNFGAFSVPEVQQPTAINAIGNEMSESELLPLITETNQISVIESPEDINIDLSLIGFSDEIPSFYLGNDADAKETEVKRHFQDYIDREKEDIIEESRNIITAWSLDETELGELFQPFKLEDEDLSSSSDSKSSSSAELSVDHYQLRVNMDVYLGTYGFEKKCRENMESLPKFLLKTWIYDIADKVASDQDNLYVFLQLLSVLNTHKSEISLSNKDNALISSIFSDLCNVMKKTNDLFFFAKMSAVKWDSNSLKFLRLGTYATVEKRDLAVSTKPQLKTPQHVRNVSIDTAWAYTDLKQRDLTRILSCEIKHIEKFIQISPLLHCFDQIIEFSRIMDESSDEEYDF